MKISVCIQREIARSIELGLSNRIIARHLGISPTTVSDFRKRLLISNKTYQDLARLDDSSFLSALGTKTKVYNSAKKAVDWSHIQDELRRPNVTLNLLWQEYLYCNKDVPTMCLSYSQFGRLFNKWLKTQRISMRQIHVPGERFFVDFCGQSIDIVNSITGETRKAYIFVGVLGASSYIFAHAVSSQSSKDWIECHIQAFKFLEGVPKQVVPDNLKAAVIKHTKNEIQINREYQECAEHYNFLINPARSRKPKDKSLAEIGVQIVQRCILARFRNIKFFSIEELNAEIAKGIALINKKASKSYGNKNRHQRFLEMDKPVLLPLPMQPYEISSWIHNVTISDDYHVEYSGSYYSVPYQYRFHKVDLRITRTMIEVLLNRQGIACHQLLSTPGISRLTEHMPESHRYQLNQEPEALLAWAEQIGPSVLLWVQYNLENRKDFANGLKAVKNLRNWVRESQNHARLETACEFALHYNIFSFSRLKNIVGSGCDIRQPIEQTSWVKQHCNLRGSEYYRIKETINAD